MTINEMRGYISSKYPGMKWKNRVYNMPTNQVIAIYRSFKNKEEREKRSCRIATPTSVGEPDGYHQINMFEYLYSINEGKETHTEVNIS